MAFENDSETRLRGIPAPILIAVTILWISSIHGLVRAGPDWVDYVGRGDSDPYTGFLLLVLTGAALINAALGLGIQLHWRWARSAAIWLSLGRTGVAMIAAAAGDSPSYLSVAINILIVILMLMPSSAAWFHR